MLHSQRRDPVEYSARADGNRGEIRSPEATFREMRAQLGDRESVTIDNLFEPSESKFARDVQEWRAKMGPKMDKITAHRAEKAARDEQNRAELAAEEDLLLLARIC